MSRKLKVLVTSKSFGKTNPLPLEMLEKSGCQITMNPCNRPLKEEELIPLMADIDGVVAGLDEYTARVMESSKGLKVISRYGVGLDNVDVAAAKRLGIVVANTPDVNTEAVADLTFGLILAACRLIPQAHSSTQAGRWERFMGRGVFQKVIGIVGLGRIGKAVARRAAGFEMSILACDITPDRSFTQDAAVRFVSLDRLLGEADFVTLHCALNDTSKRLIAARELGLMKKTAYLINTARGELVDENALYEALVAENIAGAALDTYGEEPPRNSRLLGLSNIVTTPHIGAYTQEALLAMGLASVDNLLKVLTSSSVLEAR